MVIMLGVIRVHPSLQNLDRVPLSELVVASFGSISLDGNNV